MLHFSPIFTLLTCSIPVVSMFFQSKWNTVWILIRWPCHFVEPDLDPNSDGFFERVDFEKHQQTTLSQTSMQNYPACKELKKSVSYLKLWDYIMDKSVNMQ